MKIAMIERDSLGIDVDITELEQLGDLVLYASTAAEEVSDHIKDADIVISNKVPLNEETLKGADSVKLIAQTSTGTNNVDFAVTEKMGIKVANVPSYSTDSVAQHTFALLLSLVNKVGYFDEYIKSGTYSRSNCFSKVDMIFPEIAGKTWGIIGMGAIGRKVAQIATAFGCRVITYSASGRTYEMPYEQADFDTLLAQADILSLHAPLNEYTKDLMNYEAFSKMKKTAYFINVARGMSVVEEDLAKALNEGLIAGAGLDVFRTEPMKEDHPLLHLECPEKILMTPHVAWATSEARQRCVDVVTENIKAFLRGEDQNIVKG